MPTLTVKTPDGIERHIPLIKTITSVGRAPDNAVILEDPSAPPTAFHIQLKEGVFILSTHEGKVLVNDLRRDEHRLALGDVIAVGGTRLLFGEAARPIPPPPAPVQAPAGQPGQVADVAALNRMLSFSECLLSRYEIGPLLEMMMDQVVELTRADKGFLILLEGNELRVKVARNVKQENIEDAVSRVSDSIIAKVLKSKGPMIVSDALNDVEFKSSDSVVNLKLLSVMCAPLMEKGELFGLIYVGNDKVANLFEPKSLDLLTIYAAQASLIVRNALLVNDLRMDNADLRKQLDDKRYGEIIGSCQSMRDVYRKIDKVSGTDISVLITGETGTGKELIAREIHKRGPRAKGPFITINCGAIPENLLESELFGHVKGAFTGAIATRPGKFQAANGGTLFLDEIGEMPLQLQVKILRALQEKQVVKVGDARPEMVDIRVVAATNKILEDEIKKGAFREDLYYRLNVVALRLPPLRERGDDIVVIAKYLLGKFTREFNSKAKGFSPNATIFLSRYTWPGNIRELENRLKKAVVLADKLHLTAEDLDLTPESLEPIVPLAQAKEEWQKRYINEVYARNNRNKTKTAKDLGVDPRTIFRHFEKLEAEQSGRALPPELGDPPLPDEP